MADAKSSEPKLTDVETPVGAPSEPVADTSDVNSSTPEPAPAPEVPATSSETHDHVAIRDFGARFEHQVLFFKGNEVIDTRVGKTLRALGAPIKLVEKIAKETKGRL